MVLKEIKTFSFEGEPNVGSCIKESLIAGGFVPAQTDKADVVFTYCVSESMLEDKYYGTKGLLQVTKKDVILVDLSPSTISFAQELCAMGSVSEKHILDAPLVVQNIVSLQAFSDQTNLAMIVGGAEEVFKRAEAMLRTIVSKVLWMGEAGCGQAAKVALTLSSAAALVGLVEAFASLKSSETQGAHISEEDYLDIALSLRVLTPMQEAFVQAMEEGMFKDVSSTHKSSFTMEYLMGELAAALACVDDGDVILPQAEAGFRLMELLALVGGVTYNPAALKLVFSDEETSKQYGLDWSRAEGAFEHDHCDCDESDHECSCNDGDECDCTHHHTHYGNTSSYISFSSN